MGPAVMARALEPPHEARPSLCGGAAGSCRTRKRGDGFCAQLPPDDSAADAEL
jgi:hypothetical protein